MGERTGCIGETAEGKESHEDNGWGLSEDHFGWFFDRGCEWLAIWSRGRDDMWCGAGRAAVISALRGRTLGSTVTNIGRYLSDCMHKVRYTLPTTRN